MIFRLIALLTGFMFSPAGVWRRQKEESAENNEEFYRSYLYPIFGITALFSFIGAIIHVGKFDTSYALKFVILQLFVYAGAFYLSAFLLSTALEKYKYTKAKSRFRSERFVGYSSAWIYLVGWAWMVCQDCPLIILLALLGIYTVIAGVKYYLPVDEKSRPMVSLISIMIVYVVFFVLHFLSNTITHFDKI